MKYLLDTCVLSDFVKGDVATMKRVKNSIPNELAISSITVMEIEYGILRIPGKKAENIRKIAHEFIEVINVLPFNQEISVEAAVIRAELSRRGSLIGAYDVLIAATARYHDLIMVTANTKEFIKIDGLKVENWRE